MCRLLGQTIVVIDGVSDIGLATTRLAKDQGARLIITGRNPGRLDDAADEIGVEATATVDDQDVGLLEAFLVGLPTRVDHIALCLPAGAPARLKEADFAEVRQPLDGLDLPLCVAWFAVREMTDGGSLVFVSRSAPDLSRIGVVSEMTNAALSALVAGLARESAAIRVNLVTASAQDRPEGIASLVVQLMTDVAVTGATCHVR
jgi:NAD(P)-dependent dehydrogenase (short-subunit alcohol dehydrogenase family)